MRTERVAGCVCEWGPNGYLTNVSHTEDLAGELGLASRRLRADPGSAARYLWVRGALREVPLRPPAFLKSGLLTAGGKLRVLAEPFIRAGDPDREETVAAFASRRIGRQAATTLVDAMVSGVYAGDPEALSLRAVFPRMAEMEADHGSLFRAMIAARKRGGGGGPAGPGGVLTSFDEGMEVLIRALVDSLGDRVRTGTRVDSVTPTEAGFQIRSGPGDPVRRWDATRVVLAVPAPVAAGLLPADRRKLTGALDAIPYAGVSVVCLVYRRNQVRHPLDGFGFLVPHGQGPRMLGCLWVGSIFPAHTPGDHVLLRVMLGGARDPELVDLGEAEAVEHARRELAPILGIEGAPRETVVFRHPRAIPQYTIGHLSRLRVLERELVGLPGLHLAGNAYRGIGVNDCVAEAKLLADRLTGVGSPAPAERG
jgi:oxygen-dependent protoporphyrinogen oxidase